MPNEGDFLLHQDYDPAEAWYAQCARKLYEHVEEMWQEDYAESLEDPLDANATDYYNGLYQFVDSLAWRMMQAAMRSLERGEWRDAPRGEVDMR